MIKLMKETEFNESPDSLNCRFKHLLIITQKFWNRWRKEYLTELRESHRTLLARRKASNVVKDGEVVVIHDENLPRGQWQFGRIQQVIRGSDGQVRGVRIRTQTKTGRSTVLQHPVQLLYPLEINCQPRSNDQQEDALTTNSAMNHATIQETRNHTQHAAAIRGQRRVSRVDDRLTHASGNFSCHYHIIVLLGMHVL